MSGKMTDHARQYHPGWAGRKNHFEGWVLRLSMAHRDGEILITHDGLRSTSLNSICCHLYSWVSNIHVSFKYFAEEKTVNRNGD
jgi:hypothetical protein